MHHIIEILYGIVFGVANIIPGVSGGTMLVVFGCYDKVCGALSLKFREIKKNIVFLIFFGIGAVIGLIGFSFVITFLFDNYPVPTNMFFIGLILGSVPLILRNATVKEKFKPYCIIPFLLAAALVVGLTILQNNTDASQYKYDYVVDDSDITFFMENTSGDTITWSAEIETDGELVGADGVKVEEKNSVLDKLKNLIKGKSESGMKKYVVSSESKLAPNEEASLTVFGSWTASPVIGETPLVAKQMSFVLFITLVGALALAAVAMIIPGVSGSFVMMTIGIYETAISTLKNFDFITMIPIVIGILIGLVFGAKLITALMKRYALIVYSAILGLVVASVYAILPGGFGLNIQTLIGVFAMLVGGAISFIIGKNTKTEA